MLDDFVTALAVDSQKTRRQCGFGRWLRELDAEDQQRARMLVADSSYNCRQLARYFQSKGATFNDQVVNRHRNGKCCGQSSRSSG